MEDKKARWRTGKCLSSVRVCDNLLEEIKFVSWTKMFSKGIHKISLVVIWCKLHGKNEKENTVFKIRCVGVKFNWLITVKLEVEGLGRSM